MSTINDEKIPNNIDLAQDQKLQRALADCYREQVGAHPSGEMGEPASEPGGER